MDRIDWRTTFPKLASLTLAIVYISGFLVLQSHLGRHGVFVVDIASLRYLTAGVLFVAFLVIWYLFPGRAIILGKKWINDEIELAAEMGLGSIWNFMSFINSLIIIGFFVCLGSATFSYIILESRDATPLFYYLMALFVIEYPWDVLNFDHRFPRVNRVFFLATRSSGTLVFLITTSSASTTMRVFWTFLVMSVFVNLVLDSFERFRVTYDRLTYNIVWSTVFVLVLSSTFGRLYYGHIKPAFGGGQLQPIEIMISDRTVRDGLKEMGLEGTSLLSAELVHENRQEYIVTVQGETIRLSKATIGGVRVLPIAGIQ